MINSSLDTGRSILFMEGIIGADHI